MLRQYGDFADDGGQFAVSRRVERKGDLAFCGLFGLGDMPVVRCIHRAVFFQGLKREDHVLRRHRLAVVPARLLAQPVFDPGEIVGIGSRLGQQSVKGGDLVQRTDGQGFVDQPDRGCEGALHARYGQIEVVEGADRNLAHHAALGRVGIDVVEALEIGGVFDVAEQRQAVPPERFAGCGLCAGRAEDGKAGCGA